ncbi:MAG: hypothetical protein IJR88_03355 [Clostridia bacterium]|nr:hypothetical protein [Clostridia bacterium]
MKPIDQNACRGQFDAICPLPGILPSEYLNAAKTRGITTLFVFLQGESAGTWRACESDSVVILSPEDWGRPEISKNDCYFSFTHFFYEKYAWNLLNPDEFSLLLSRFSGGAEEFLSAYKEAFKAVLRISKSRIAFGLEAVAKLLGTKICDSALYRKTMLDLADELVARGFAVCYATGHPVCDLSPFVLRRMSERRGDILLASFAEKPEDVGQGIKKSALSARAAGFGGYVTYSNRELVRVPNAIQKETL